MRLYLREAENNSVTLSILWHHFTKKNYVIHQSGICTYQNVWDTMQWEFHIYYTQ